jgi:hypothetical protein
MEKLTTSFAVGVMTGAVALLGAGGCGTESPTDSSAQALPASIDGPSTEPGAASAASGKADAGIPAIDRAAPGSTFPAAHPAMPRVVSSGGHVIVKPNVVAVTFNGDPYQPTIDEFAGSFPGTDFWTANVAEYGVGRLTARNPIHLTTRAPLLIDDSGIQSWLRSRVDGTHAEWGTPDESTIYTVFYPTGTVVTLQGYLSCITYGGYHSEVLVGAKKVAYAVIPRCPSFLGLHGFDVVTVAASHELIEAATDPHPYTAPAYAFPDDDHAVWGYYTGGETGDMCTFNDGVFYDPPGLDFKVQRSWSNAAAAGGHDPCVPALPGRVYFNSAPVMPDVIKSRGISTKGVRIPVGGSRTIELDLYSDGPTDPWLVSAVDLSVLEGGKQLLQFEFDKTRGANGDKLHMTVTAVGIDPRYDGEGFAVLSELNGRRNVWYGLVGN